METFTLIIFPSGTAIIINPIIVAKTATMDESIINVVFMINFLSQHLKVKMDK
jgi:hypothetical protein